jgi:hypothetical protein
VRKFLPSRYRAVEVPMPFSLVNASRQSLLKEAFDEAWLTLGRGTGWSAKRKAETMDQLTRQLLAAADSGVRDHNRLVLAALEGVDRS